jgi:hypothetical protein
LRKRRSYECRRGQRGGTDQYEFHLGLL